MIRALRVLVLAVVIATSLLAGGSIASADPGRAKAPAPPARVTDITWE